MHCVESARIIVIMRTPHFSREFNDSSVRKCRKCFVRFGKEGNLRTRMRRQFDSEVFPVGGHQGGIHHAAIEYGWHVIGNGKAWGRRKRSARHECDACECYRTAESQPKGNAPATKHLAAEGDGEQTTCKAAPGSRSKGNNADCRDCYSNRDRRERYKKWFVDPQTIQSPRADKFSGNQAACKELEIDPGPIPTRIEAFVCSSQARTTKVL